MPAPAVSPVVRAILTENINLSADEVIRKANLRGVTASDASIRTLAHNIKSMLKKEAAKGGNKASSPKPALPKPTLPKATSPQPAPAAARATKSSVPEVAAPAPAPVASSPGFDLSAVLANVALVNAVVGACGGAEPARKVAEAVKACGGVEAFLQHLDLVAQVRG